MVWRSCRNGTSTEIVFLSFEKKNVKENTAIQNNKTNKNDDIY